MPFNYGGTAAYIGPHPWSAGFASVKLSFSIAYFVAARRIAQLRRCECNTLPERLACNVALASQKQSVESRGRGWALINCYRVCSTYLAMKAPSTQSEKLPCRYAVHKSITHDIISSNKCCNRRICFWLGGITGFSKRHAQIRRWAECGCCAAVEVFIALRSKPKGDTHAVHAYIKWMRRRKRCPKTSRGNETSKNLVNQRTRSEKGITYAIYQVSV